MEQSHGAGWGGRGVDCAGEAVRAGHFCGLVVDWRMSELQLQMVLERVEVE